MILATIPFARSLASFSIATAMLSSLVPDITTFAPAERNAFAMPMPIPPVPPTIKAILPLSKFVSCVGIFTGTMFFSFRLRKQKSKNLYILDAMPIIVPHFIIFFKALTPLSPKIDLTNLFPLLANSSPKLNLIFVFKYLIASASS